MPDSTAAEVDSRTRSGPGPVRQMDLRPLAWTLMAVTLALVAVNVVVKLVAASADPPRDMTVWLRTFDVNNESNVPTMWNATLLLGIGVANVLVATLTPRGARMPRLGWVLPAAVAVVMATDEMLRWHEQLRAVGARMAGAMDVAPPTYVWLLPGAVVAVGMVLAVLLWSRRLPSDVRTGLVVAVVVYFSGAIGLEALSGWVDVTYGHARLLYHAVTTGEELLEMTGCVIAVVAVLRMLRATDVHGRTALLLRPDA